MRRFAFRWGWIVAFSVTFSRVAERIICQGDTMATGAFEELIDLDEVPELIKCLFE
jgi:hypothetical protein